MREGPSARGTGQANIRKHTEKQYRNSADQYGGDIANTAKQPAGNPWCAAGAASNFQRSVGGQRHIKARCLIGKDHRQFVTTIELQPHLDAKPVT